MPKVHPTEAMKFAQNFMKNYKKNKSSGKKGDKAQQYSNDIKEYVDSLRNKFKGKSVREVEKFIKIQREKVNIEKDDDLEEVVVKEARRKRREPREAPAREREDFNAGKLEKEKARMEDRRKSLKKAISFRKGRGDRLPKKGYAGKFSLDDVNVKVGDKNKEIDIKAKIEGRRELSYRKDRMRRGFVGRVSMDDINIEVGDRNEEIDIETSVAAGRRGRGHPRGGGTSLDDINITIGDNNENINVSTFIRGGGVVDLDDINIDIGDNNTNVNVDIFIGGGHGHGHPMPHEIRKLRHAITDLTAEVENLNTNISDLSAQNEELSNQVTELSKTIVEKTKIDISIARRESETSREMLKSMEVNTTQMTELSSFMKALLELGISGGSGGGAGAFGPIEGGSRASKLYRAGNMVSSIRGQLVLQGFQGAGGGLYGKTGSTLMGISSGLGDVLKDLLNKILKR